MGWRSSLGIQADFLVKVTLDCEGKGIVRAVPVSTGPYCHPPKSQSDWRRTLFSWDRHKLLFLGS